MRSNSVPWWTGTVTEQPRARLSRAKRLELLEISEEDFQLYKELFLWHRRRDRYAEQSSDGTWPQFKHPWDDGLILRHLCGHTNVAIPFAERVNQIVLDIDCKRDRPWEEVESTVRSAAKALPGEPIIYQSSESRGIRMVWFLSETVSRVGLYDWTKQTLQKAGVKVVSGKCEVRLGAEPDRLPFGRGSMLLDPITLEPRFDLNLSGTLAAAKIHRDCHAVVLPATLPSTTAQREHTYREVIKACLNGGLPADMTTNECLMKLAFYGRRKLGLEKDDLKSYLRDFITRRHNGNSDRINRGRIDLVYKQIDRIVDNMRAEPGPRCRPLAYAGLSRGEVLQLLGFHLNFKTSAALFRLLCVAKARLLQRLKYRRRTETWGRKKIGTNKWGMVFHESEDITNGARNFQLYIDLSKTLLRRLRVPNAYNTANFVAEMERIGVLARKRKPWPDGGKARQFWVNFPFDPLGEPLAGDFDAVVWLILGHDGIRRRFSKHQANRIAYRMETQEHREVCAERHLGVV